VRAPAQSPPWSEEAEVTILGAIMLDEAALHDAAGSLQPTDFYREAHGRIFAACLKLWQTSTKVDYITTTNALRSSGQLESVGGTDYLAAVIDLTPHTSVRSYAQIVAETATLRRIASAAQSTAQDALDGKKKASEVLADAHTRLLGTTRQTGAGYVPASRDIMAVMEGIEQEAAGGKPRGMSVGLSGLDRILHGLQPGDLSIVAARPSMGKTALAIQIGLHAADRLGKRVLVASLEMNRHKLLRRAVSHLSRTPLTAAGQRSPQEWARIGDAATRLARLPFLINERPGQTMDQVRAGIHRAAAEAEPDLVILDYLQLLEGRGENRVQQVGQISRGLKLLAGELGCHVMALSQLSRAVESRTPPRPSLSDLRDSGTIEQDADVVVMLWRPEYYLTDADPQDLRDKQRGRAEVIVSKHRDGGTGAVWVQWDGSITTFDDAPTSTAAGRYPGP